MGFVVIKVKVGDLLKCIDDKVHRRRSGSGDDFKLPPGVVEGGEYEVVNISEDYFGSNKLVLLVEGVPVVVDPLFQSGSGYQQRFEKVEAPGKEIAWVC